jgi:N-methylhydantoinase B
MEFYDHKSSFTVLSDRTKNAPWGLFGGHAARPAKYVVNPEGDSEVVSSKSTTKLSPNDIASVQTPGGGGYGDPHDRPPDEVLEDVVNGKVSVEKARAEYGVAVDKEAREIDYSKTQTLREEMD